MRKFIIPKDLTQKWSMVCRCMKCGAFVNPVISSDGTYFGAQYFGDELPYDVDLSLWKCDSCCEAVYVEEKRKGKIGFEASR